MASQQPSRPSNPAGGGAAGRPGAASTTTTGAGASNGAASGAGSAGATNTATSTSYKPLNVKDALSYLDQVKNQFNRRPEIYNRFLDIMKDFKTQQIDTPGVIDRVSSLFRGHPSLIQGFNTFLPPGYRIDCSFEPGQDGVITVTTPHGVTRRDGNTTTSTSAAISAQNRASATATANAAAQASKPKPPGAAGQTTNAGASNVSNQLSATAAAVRQQQQQQAQAQAAQRERERQSQAAAIANQQRNLAALQKQNAAASSSSSGAAAAAAAAKAANKQPTPPVPVPGQASAGTASSAATAAGAGMAGLHAAAGAVTNGQQRSALAGQSTGDTTNARTSSTTPAPSTAATNATLKTNANRNQRETSAPDAASSSTSTTNDTQASTGTPTTTTTTAAAASAEKTNGTAQARRPAEFNHAINFVNKIKNRFHKKPETYKAFLEILQTYQKEQRPIQAVYSQVTTLFKEAPDLLDEFKEFLPDTSAPSPKNPPATTKAGTPTSQALPASSSAATTSAAGAAAASRTARNSSTTSLFGVNASGTSQPQPNQASSYLSSASAKDRKGQTLPTASLDATANRRAGVAGPAASAAVPSAVPQPAKPGQAEKAQQIPYDKQDDPYDGDWQAAQPTSARKRRAAATAAEKNRKKSRTAATEESADEYQPNAFGAQQVPPSVVRGYSSGTSGPSAPASGAAGAYQAPPATAAIPPPVQPIILPHALRPHGPRNQLQHLVNVDELALFDRVKKFLDDKAMYHEFLKLLNLYTQEIIDMPTLLEKAFLFIGTSNELFGLFREFVGEQDGFVDGEEWPIDNAPALERERVELYSLKSYGPSYRRLPYSESKGLACSGRDALCWSVLNDDWVAYATWASEGSGAHRKNPYEDALASSEQERHWYDYMIESNTRSIAVLEPIVARIGLMSMEERSSFRLKPGLGGQSTSFYERIIKKIYGRDYGQEAIQALYDSPSVAAPIILNRMKQKDDEWKRALREWNRVWREVDAKNYYRSLDHQGMTFKTNDKKVTTSKNLVQEIDTLRREQQQKRVSLSWDPATTLPLRPQHQFELQIDDFDVLFDVLKLAFSFLDRAVTPYNAKERAAIEETLRKMIPLIFSIDEKNVEANLAPAIQFEGDQEVPEVQESDDDGANMSDTAASASDSSAATGRKGTKRTAADLRRKLLSTTANGLIAKTAERADETSPEDAGDDAPVMPSLEKGTWIAASPQPWPSIPPSTPRTPRSPSKFKSVPHPSPVAQQPHAQKEQEASSLAEPRYNFFAGQSFYCFYRLFHMLYHRLATLKHEAQHIYEKQGTTTRLNPFAVDLGLAVPIPSVDDPHVPRGKNYYDYMLELCEKYFELEIDSQTFEENLRYMWGIKAFPAFTIDKVIASMVKHIHGINQDPKCHQLLDLLKIERSQDRTSVRQQIIYRHACEDVIGMEEKLFRFEWIPSSQVLTMQLMTPEDLTLDDALDSVNGGWNYYVDSYVLEQPTEGIGSEIHAPLLHRNRGLLEAKAPVVSGASDLAIRLAPDNFKLSYVKDTEETIYKVIPADATADEEIRSKRKEAWQRWLQAQDENTVNGEQMPEAHVAAETANGDDVMAISS